MADAGSAADGVRRDRRGADRAPARRQPRLALLLACYAMFGISLFVSLITITLLWGRLAFHGPGPARLVPTLWIVLGPLGQSITAAGLLGNAARERHLGSVYGHPASASGVLYGVPVWGFAMIWLAIAAAITTRTARASASLLADLVELHLPGRHGRHRHLGSWRWPPTRISSG